MEKWGRQDFSREVSVGAVACFEVSHLIVSGLVLNRILGSELLHEPQDLFRAYLMLFNFRQL